MSSKRKPQRIICSKCLEDDTRLSKEYPSSYTPKPLGQARFYLLTPPLTAFNYMQNKSYALCTGCYNDQTLYLHVWNFSTMLSYDEYRLSMIMSE